MQKLNALFSAANTAKGKIVGGAAAFVASSSAFAVDHTTAIAAAQADATANTTAVITGVIALAAVVCGAGLIWRWLAR